MCRCILQKRSCKWSRVYWQGKSFVLNLEVKEELWGGQFWSKGYYDVNTVGQYANEEVTKNYLKDQGKQKEINRFFQVNWDYLNN